MRTNVDPTLNEEQLTVVLDTGFSLSQVPGIGLINSQFQPFTYDTGTKSSYDMVLGMAFLRNVYVLMDYGDFILGSDRKGAPYVQFLSTTNATEAHDSFVKFRLSGMNNPSNHISKPRRIHPMLIYIAVAITVVAFLAVTALCFIFRVRRRNADRDEQELIRPINLKALLVMGNLNF
ncbi:hypothetical protein C0992_010893 [Termitomyces sp. T32_za158]|nr:hypothetical protein C0992_010893 [Termitomyces sp. T32_za158]